MGALELVEERAQAYRLRSCLTAEGKPPRHLAALGQSPEAVLCEEPDTPFAHWTFRRDPLGSEGVWLVRSQATGAYLTLSDSGHVPGHAERPRPPMFEVAD